MTGDSAPTPFIREWGSGPTVLFIHGLAGSSRYWKTVAATSHGYHGLAVDLIGFGRSPKPSHFAYDVDSQVEAILTVCTDPDVVVGHSVGAIIAAGFSRRTSRPTPTLLIGAPAYPTAADARSHIGELGWLARATVKETRPARTMCQAMCTLRPLAMLVAPALQRDVPASVAVDATRHTWTSYSRTVQQVLVEHRTCADIAAMSGRTIALTGSEDRVAPPHRLDRLAAHNERLEIRTVNGGNHHLALNATEHVASAISELVITGPT